MIRLYSKFTLDSVELTSGEDAVVVSRGTGGGADSNDDVDVVAVVPDDEFVIAHAMKCRVPTSTSCIRIMIPISPEISTSVNIKYRNRLKINAVVSELTRLSNTICALLAKRTLFSKNDFVRLALSSDLFSLNLFNSAKR